MEKENKICDMCGKEKPLTEFYKITAYNEYLSHCKECEKKYTQNYDYKDDFTITDILQYINDNYYFYLDITYKITRQNEISRDLLNSCIIYINDYYNHSTLIKAFKNGEFRFMFVSIIKNEWYSTNSYYYREYKRWDNINSELVYSNESNENDYNYQVDEDFRTECKKMIFNTIEDLVNTDEIKWWQGEVFKRYSMGDEHISFRKLQKSTKIVESVLWAANKTVKEKLIKRINIIKDKI